VTYSYDALGNRVSETVTDGSGTTSTTQFAYDLSGQLIGEMTGGGQWTAYLANPQGSNQFLARVDGSGVTWLLTDHQGSVIAAVSADGSQVLAQASYDAFGNVTLASGTAADLGRLRFQGGMTDAATGLVHFGARDYSPTTGRWWTPDPANADSNTYRGMGNSPTNFTDPRGLERIAVDGDTVYWVIQQEGKYVWNRDTDVRWVEIGTLQSNRTVVNFSPSFGGGSGDVSALQDFAKKFWRQYPDLTKVPEDQQNLSLRGAIERVAKNNRIQTPSVAQQYLTAAAEGTRDGAVIVANNFTFQQIDSINAYSTKVIQENGGAYVYADVSAKIAREAALTAATAGAGALAGKGLQAASLSKNALVANTACTVVTTAKVATPVMAVGQAVNVGNQLGNGINAAQNGDTAGAVGSFAQAGIGSLGLVSAAKESAGLLRDIWNKGLVASLSSCFAAGTPLLTPHGHRFIEDFQVGDLVLARSEDDLNGPVEAKRVERVFVRLGQILHLHMGQQVIKTTAAHPFFVYNKGWVSAGQLQVGDLLVSHDGQFVPVGDLLETGEYETLYNFRVEDFHTYFVGGRDWGFSVWAHNECWGTARKNKWKEEANEHADSGKYSDTNLARMSEGLAPQIQVKMKNRKTGKIVERDVSLELHHTSLPQRSGTDKAHESWNLTVATPWGHEAMDRFRHVGYDLIKILKGPNSF
jgi:RHS repeat-associated protein